MSAGVDAVVVGASGLVGSHLLRVGRERGAAVRGTAFSQSVPGLDRLDARDEASAAAYLARVRPRLVFVPAAVPHVDLCEQDPEGTRPINVTAVGALARAAAAVAARVVYYSTDYVFDGRAGPYGEDDVPNPISEYGRQKLTAERLVREAQPEDHLVLRITVVYGWERQQKNFVARLVRTLRAGDTMRVPSDQVGTPTLVDDVAEASWDLAAADARGTYHIAGPDVVDRHAFAVRAAEIFGLDASLLQPVSTAELGQPAPRPLLAGMRATKAERVLGRRLSTIDEGLAWVKATEQEQQ